MIRITLAKIGKNPTVNYAVEELFTYLKKIDPMLFVDIRSYADYDESVEGVIWVGISEKFASLITEVDDKKKDDSIYIDIKDNVGIITGVNPRSVLIASYRLLKTLGVRWIRPTDDGEVVPSFSITAINAYVNEKASYRHRAVCIEGTVSYEHVLNMIKWIPRAGMSGYFFQFFRPYFFFYHWYTHSYNNYYEAESINRDDVVAIVAGLSEEIEKRDLLLHRVGHGWTCEPFGIPGDGWNAMKDEEATEEQRSYLAMVGGERKFFGGIPLNTNLCYSNPKVRDMLTTYMADYCEQNPEVKFLHFWLADDINNHCECENCIERPSDYFVMMLNDVDAKLTARNIDTKIVFLVYYDLLWGPVKEKLNNPDRFVLMFAPITRTYTHSYDELDLSKQYVEPEFVKNHVVCPTELEANFALLKSWKTIHDSDSFVFDYHNMWDHLKDPGYYKCAEILFRDMQSLHRVGLQGMVSCQLTRCSFPTALPMQMMADALWDENCDFEVKSNDYFLSAFGEDWPVVKDYLKALSHNIDPEYARGEKPYSVDERKARVTKAKVLATEFESVIARNLEKSLPEAQHKSWEYLTYHKTYVIKYAEAILAGINEGDEARDKKIAEFFDYFMLNEQKLHKVLDVNMACGVIAGACKQ